MHFQLLENHKLLIWSDYTVGRYSIVASRPKHVQIVPVLARDGNHLTVELNDVFKWAGVSFS